MKGAGLEELSTERLIIRPFVSSDLESIHRILNAAFGAGDPLEQVSSWLDWNALSARWLPAMRQPPYGDRAVALRATGQVIGAAGFVPMLMPFDQIPELAREPGAGSSGRMTPEVGLLWAIDPPLQGQGYGTEAGGALIDYAFSHLRLWRILATTQHDNLASQAVMRKLNMTLTRNPLPEPKWMQVVGVRYAGSVGTASIPRTTGVINLMSNLRFLTAGESHGPVLTAILEGMIAGLPISSGSHRP